jgi:hypothetical protein
LVNGFEELFLASPEPALCDKDIPALGTDQNVSFPLKIESLACGTAFILRVQLNQEMCSSS